MMLQGTILLVFARDHLCLALERVYSVLFILLFSSVKSANDLKDLSGLDIGGNIGHAHSDVFTFCNTPKSTSL
jgi:hypothetical protein